MASKATSANKFHSHQIPPNLMILRLKTSKLPNYLINFMTNWSIKKRGNHFPMINFRNALEKKIIRILMNLKENKNILINLEWANAYTNYLQGHSFSMKKIQNEALKNLCDDPNATIREDVDFVLNLN